MAICDKSGLVKKVCQLYEQCSRLEGLPPCALVAAHSTSDNTTNNAIALWKEALSVHHSGGDVGGWIAINNDRISVVVAQQH